MIRIRTGIRMGWILRIIRSIIIVLIPVVIVAYWLDLIKITTSGVSIKREDDLTRESLIRRANLYYQIFAYGSAMRIYDRLVFGGEEPEPYYVDYVNFLYDRRGRSDMPVLLFRLASCYSKMNKRKEAVAAFRAFVELFPQDPLVRDAQKRATELELRRMY